MPNSLFSLDSISNKPHRSGFDLSCRRSFTAKVGELLPIYWNLCIPGDSFKINTQWFTRTQPVETSAYTRFKEYFDFFYIPLRQLWRSAPSVLTQMVDNPLEATSPNSFASLSTSLPHTTLGNLSQALKELNDYNNHFGFNRADCAFKLMSYLGYGNFIDNTGADVRFYGTSLGYNDENRKWYSQYYSNDLFVNIFPILAYNKIYNDYFRSSQWEQSYPFTYNVDYFFGQNSSINLEDQNPDSSPVSIDLRYCNWHKDLLMGVVPNSQYGDVASVSAVSTSEINPNNVSPVWLRGFAIRSEGLDWDDVSVGNFQTLDKIGTYGDLRSSLSSVSRLLDGAGMWINTDGINGLQLGQFYKTMEAEDGNFEHAYATPLLSMADSSFNFFTRLGINPNDVFSQYTNDFSVLALRQAEALQKWREVSQTGGQDYKSQLEKHFGVKISSLLSDLVDFVGGSSSILTISEVLNQDLASDDAQPIVAGKGVTAGNGNTIKYDIKEHGILMCIYHCVPLLDYVLSGQNPQLLATDATDLPIPEFDNIGLEEVPLLSFINSNLCSADYAFTYAGFNPRYYAYKSNLDQVFGAFTTTLRDWVAPIDQQYLAENINVQGKSNYYPLNYAFFKVNPSICDSIFGVNADSTWDTDQLLITAQLNIHAVRNLSFSGMPY